MLTAEKRRAYYKNVALSILMEGKGNTMICCELERLLYQNDVTHAYKLDYGYILGVYFPEMRIISEGYATDHENYDPDDIDYWYIEAIEDAQERMGVRLTVLALAIVMTYDEENPAT